MSSDPDPVLTTGLGVLDLEQRLGPRRAITDKDAVQLARSNSYNPQNEKPKRYREARNMYRKILIPTDGSPISRKAVKEGITLAKQIGAKVVGFFSPEDYRVMMYSEFVPPVVVSEEEFQAQMKKIAKKQLGFVEKSAKAAGVPYEAYYVASITPWEAIIDAAKKKKCDLICMGSHGRSGLAGVVLGSQTTKVLTHSNIPVLVTR